MTTTKPEIRRDSEQWTPYPHLPPEPKDMELMPPIDDLTGKLRSILTPGDQYPYHPTILSGGQIPIYYGAANPVTNRGRIRARLSDENNRLRAEIRRLRSGEPPA